MRLHISDGIGWFEDSGEHMIETFTGIKTKLIPITLKCDNLLNVDSMTRFGGFTDENAPMLATDGGGWLQLLTELKAY
jgi:hypothetical protein